MSALKDLIAAVEADSTETLAWRQIFGWDETLNADAALKGSLDAAKALHDALLPGWEYAIYSPSPDYKLYQVQLETVAIREAFDLEPISGEADNPARAWLIATLKALESKNADA